MTDHPMPKHYVFGSTEIAESYRMGLMADGFHRSRLPWVPFYKEGTVPKYRILLRFHYTPDELANAPAPKPIVGGM